ncbi:toxin RTX-I translocation ATP-binding protein [mine drainage metagenome]|uniref:Toxin RTX-I translocation ATP-binding protein n=1 Tax=mine drainage metagenome TaxID=410659 RepID=A0A1J5TC97_9ZZZZ
MPRRLFKIVSNRLSREPVRNSLTFIFELEDVVWAMGSFCALNRKPFDAELLAKQFPPPYNSDSFIHAARALGFRIKRRDCDGATLSTLNLPCLVVLNEASSENDSSETVRPEPGGTTSHSTKPTSGQVAGYVEGQSASVDTGIPPVKPAPAARKFHPAIIVQMTAENVILFEVGTNTPKTMTQAEFATHFAGTAFQLALETKGIKDPDGALNKQAAFGFNWFIPELLKHKRIWRDVLIASLIIQLLGLVTPLFTQVIIDKVVVHRTQSTLIVIAIALAVFMVFSALLSWVRQYLILHTGNRVDAVLGFAVFDRLFKLPTRYFEHRPTGVIAARLHGVETIREFIASAAVMLILDFPFLLIFLAMML